MHPLCWTSFTGRGGKKKSISVVQMRACSTHYITFFIEVFKPFIWQPPPTLVRFPKHTIRRICETPPPPTSVPQKPWFIRERFMWLYWVLTGEPSTPVVCFEMYCLREREGDREFSVQETWGGRNNTFSICLRNVFYFLNSFFFLALLMTEIKLQYTTVYLYLCINTNAVDHCWISLDIKCCWFQPALICTDCRINASSLPQNLIYKQME